ncbi:hypothetical protein F5H01DRAFT_93324 [Linnemannia elongata]|nr:hypothetical protein F5H01DRAFT_93324 [Linnemannia elongata]
MLYWGIAVGLCLCRYLLSLQLKLVSLSFFIIFFVVFLVLSFPFLHPRYSLRRCTFPLPSLSLPPLLPSLSLPLFFSSLANPLQEQFAPLTCQLALDQSSTPHSFTLTILIPTTALLHLAILLSPIQPITIIINTQQTQIAISLNSIFTLLTTLSFHDQSFSTRRTQPYALHAPFFRFSWSR